MSNSDKYYTFNEEEIRVLEFDEKEIMLDMKYFVSDNFISFLMVSFFLYEQLEKIYHINCLQSNAHVGVENIGIRNWWFGNKKKKS